MNYVGRVIRPPSETNAIILQVTVGCSYNLGKEVDAGTFILPTATEILHELKLLISYLEGITCQFHANQASSYLPLAGRLPRDKDTLLAAIDLALAGAIPLVPEYRRAL